MFSCFDDPRAVLQKIYDHLEPGGWVEYQDTAMEITGSDPVTDEYIRASSLARWIDLFKAGLRSATGRSPEVALLYAGWMKEIGFVDVVERPCLAPINSWPLDPDDQLLGKFVRLDTEKVVDSSVKLLLAGGMTQDELPAFKEAVKWSLGDRNMRGYYVGRSIRDFNAPQNYPTEILTAMCQIILSTDENLLPKPCRAKGPPMSTYSEN